MGFNSGFKGLTASGITLERGGSSVVGRSCETVASRWLIYLNCMMMHAPANVRVFVSSCLSVRPSVSPFVNME